MWYLSLPWICPGDLYLRLLPYARRLFRFNFIKYSLWGEKKIQCLLFIYLFSVNYWHTINACYLQCIELNC